MTQITLCRGCGEDRVLSPEYLCIPCYDAAKAMLKDWNEHYAKWEKMTPEERWEKVKAAL